MPAELTDKLFAEDIDNSSTRFQLNALECDYYKNNIIVNKVQASRICNLTMNQSNTQLWYKERASRITASCAHKIWRARNAVNRLKYFKGNSSGADNTLENFKYGHENEPLAILKYEEVSGNKVERCGLVIKMDKCYLAASPDGLVVDENGDIIVLEVKCPIKCKDKNVLTEYLDQDYVNGRIEHTLSKKHQYFTQVQLQLFCCGAKKAHFFVFSSADYVLVEVSYDEEYVQNVIQKLEDYYFTEFLQQIQK